MRKSGAPTDATPEGQAGEPGQEESAPESGQPEAQAQPETLPTAGLVSPLAPTIAIAPQPALTAAPATDA